MHTYYYKSQLTVQSKPVGWKHAFEQSTQSERALCDIGKDYYQGEGQTIWLVVVGKVNAHLLLQISTDCTVKTGWLETRL